MREGDWPNQTTRTGTIDEMLKITAAAGEVSISGGDPPSFGWTLRFPCEAVNELIRKLEAARDAAALMAERGG
jgi:hypothetical protein